MAKRRSIITLDDEERDVLKEAADGRPMENIIRRLRKLLAEGLDPVKKLQSADELEHEHLVGARRGLESRLDLLRSLPELGDEVREAAEAPLRRGIELCTKIEAEHFGEHTGSTPATELTSVAPVSSQPAI